MRTSDWILLFLFFTISSCSQEEIAVDQEAPEINILFPESNTEYAQGDTVFIRAYFSDLKGLRNGSVHIHDQFLISPADTVYSYSFRLNDVIFDLDTFWIVNDPSDKSYVIYIDGTDRAENYTQKLRYFHQFH
jgi:hypothetical protein